MRRTADDNLSPIEQQAARLIVNNAIDNITTSVTTASASNEQDVEGNEE